MGGGPAPVPAKWIGWPGFYLPPSPLPTCPASKPITTHAVVIEGLHGPLPYVVAARIHPLPLDLCAQGEQRLSRLHIQGLWSPSLAVGGHMQVVRGDDRSTDEVGLVHGLELPYRS
jgi:hypothetical protein